MISAWAFIALVDRDPTPGAYTAEPLSPEEIDALPNADRVWATILAAREYIDVIKEERDESCSHS